MAHTSIIKWFICTKFYTCLHGNMPFNSESKVKRRGLHETTDDPEVDNATSLSPCYVFSLFKTNISL